MVKKSVKKAAKSSDPTRNDVLIEVTITMPDGTQVYEEMRIINPSGCILKSDISNADMVYENLTKGMADIYGRGHVTK